MPRSRIAESCSELAFFGFIRILLLFSIVVAPIFIPTNSVGGGWFPFLHILTSIYYLWTYLVMAVLTSVVSTFICSCISPSN